MQKVVNVETKTGLQFSAMIHNIGSHYLKNLYFSYTIASKMQIQESSAKKIYFEGFKAKMLKLTCLETDKLIKKNKKVMKNKKKRF